MKKSSRVEAWMEKSGIVSHAGFDPFYLAYFECFNKGLYYEAHDVLEQLWLREKRKVGENENFFKGLIQLAGAFVHLKKQFERPWHAKDGRRLRPAKRLFHLAMTNLLPFASNGGHWGLDVGQVCQLCREYMAALEQGGFARNPWTPEELPQLVLVK